MKITWENSMFTRIRARADGQTVIQTDRQTSRIHKHLTTLEGDKKGGEGHLFSAI